VVRQVVQEHLAHQEHQVQAVVQVHQVQVVLQELVE
jgi:hypothetical protein